MRTSLYLVDDEEETHSEGGGYVTLVYSVSDSQTRFNNLPEIIQKAINFNITNITWNEWLVYELAFLSGDGALASVALRRKKIGLEFTMLVFAVQKYLSRFSEIEINGKLNDATLEAMRAWSLKTIAYNEQQVAYSEATKRDMLGYAKNSYLDLVTKEKNAGNKEFSWMVLSVQRKLFPGEAEKHDGKYGTGTSKKLHEILSKEKLNSQEQIKEFSKATDYNKANVKYEKWLIYELAFLSGNGDLAAAIFRDPKIGHEFTMLVVGTQKYLSRFGAKVPVDGKLTKATLDAMHTWSMDTIAYNKEHIADPKTVKQQMLEYANNSYLDNVTKEKNAGNKEFSWIILSIQRKLFPGEAGKHDGKYGPGTTTKLQEAIRTKKMEWEQQMQELVKEAGESNKFKHPQINLLNLPKSVVFRGTKQVTWAGDPFSVVVSVIARVFAKNYLPDQLNICVYYNGKEYYNREDISSYNLDLFSKKENYNPVIYTLPPDLEKNTDSISNSLFVDVYGDGSYVVLLKDTTFFDKSWSPAWREHRMVADRIGKRTGQLEPLIVKPIESVPSDGTPVKSERISGKTTLTEYEALIAAQINLNNILKNVNTYGVSNRGDWARLDKRVEVALNHVGSHPSSPIIASHAIALVRMLENIRIKLMNTAESQKKETYPASIADQAVLLVMTVRALYEKAALQSFSDLNAANQTLHTADVFYNRLPYQLTNLYLQKGKGIEEQISYLREIGSQIIQFRDEGDLLPEFMNLENVLGLRRDQYGSGTTDYLNTLLKQYNNESESAKPEATTHTNELTVTTQHLTGLFGMVSTYEMLRMFRSQTGILGREWAILSFNNATVMTDIYISLLRNSLKELNKEYKRLGGSINKNNYAQWHAAENEALQVFYSLQNSSRFKSDLQKIVELLETVKTIEKVVKQLAVIALAAVVSSVLTPAAGLVVADMAGVAELGFAASTVVESTIFTLAHRGLSSGLLGEKNGNFVTDLISNTLTFGLLKGAGVLHEKVFVRFLGKDAVGGGLFKTTEAISTAVSLQGLANVEYYLANGKRMSMEENGIALLQNVTLMGFIGLGNFMAEPLTKRLNVKVQEVLKKNFAREIKLIEENRVTLKALMKEAQGTKKLSPGRMKELGKTLETQLNAEVALLEMAKAKGLNEKLAEAEIANYRNRIIELELQLSKMGVEVQLGMKDYLAMEEPGVFSYKDASVIPELKTYYESLPGGKFEKLHDGVYRASTGQESVEFKPSNHSENKPESNKDPNKDKDKEKEDPIPIDIFKLLEEKLRGLNSTWKERGIKRSTWKEEDIQKIITSIKGAESGKYLAESFIRHLELAGKNAAKVEGIIDLLNAAKQINGDKTSFTEDFLKQTLEKGDELIAKGEDIYFEPDGYEAAVDIAVFRDGEPSEILQLKAVNLSKATKRINEAVSVLKSTGSEAKKEVYIWIKDGSKELFAPKIKTLKTLHSNSGIDIFIRFGENSNYTNLFDL